MGKYKGSGARGQILLLVVVVMVVVLTVGLSVASRTITNLKLSRQDEDSQKAFQAASAGIDKYINTAASNPAAEALPVGSFDTNVTDVGSGLTSLILNNNEVVDQDRGIDVWLSNYPNFASPYNGTIVISWGTSDQTECTLSAGSKTVPAIEILLLTGARTAPVLNKYVYDGCPSRQGANGFSAPLGTTTIGTTPFRNSTSSLSITTGGLIMKVIPIYNSTKIAIKGVPTAPSIGFPAQGKLIESVGTVGDATRKIVYYESYPQLPNEIFPYAILSQ